MRAGQDPALFWEQTPATYAAVMDGVQARLEDEQKARLSLAWHTAQLGAVAYHQPNKLPAHDRFVGLKRLVKLQSAAEAAANVRAWAVVLGQA